MRTGTALVLSISLGLVTHAAAEPTLQIAQTSQPSIVGYVDPGRPLTGYIVVDAPLMEEKANSKIIYLNRCQGGCAITASSTTNDSRTDRSTVPFDPALNNSGQVYNLPAYPYGDASWTAVVDCVRELYAPFDIEITDQDPGDVPHFEGMVAGDPSDLNFPAEVGGVAPFHAFCGTINNGISFTFPTVWQGNTRSICETVAQETAHVFGLDHEFHCPDPMTYLFGCGEKRFRDVDSPCGEYSNRTCACGAQTQNSFREILEEFGPGNPTPPDVRITHPQDGAEVTPGFIVRTEITDNIEVARAELYIDGVVVNEINNPPFVFNAPLDIAEGNHEITVRGYDDLSTPGSATINVVVGGPCASAAECAEAEACVGGRCVLGPGAPGGLGESCAADNTICATGLCAEDGAGNAYCTTSCNLTANDCPCDYSCLDAGGTGVCWPGGNECDTGGCGLTPGGEDGDPPVLPILFGLAFGALFLLRRRD